MEAVYENWFDYEINGKMTLFVFEEMFFDELSNFDKLTKSISICDESSMVTVLEINKEAIEIRLKEIIEKFKVWVANVIKFLEKKWDDLKTKARWLTYKVYGDPGIKEDVKVPGIEFIINGKTRSGDVRDVFKNIDEIIDKEMDTSLQDSELYSITKQGEPIVLRKGPMSLVDYINDYVNYSKDIDRIHHNIIRKINDLSIKVNLQKYRSSLAATVENETDYKEAKDKIADITKRIKCLEEIDKMVMTIWALSNNNAAKATAVFRDSKAGKSGKFEYK